MMGTKVCVCVCCVCMCVGEGVWVCVCGCDSYTIWSCSVLIPELGGHLSLLMWCSACTCTYVLYTTTMYVLYSTNSYMYVCYVMNCSRVFFCDLIRLVSYNNYVI